MAKIIFWSPISKMTGATHAIIATATLMGIEEQFSCMILHGHWQNKKIESSFSDYDTLKNTNIFGNTNIGMTALSRLVESNKLTPDSIKNYAKPVLKQRLDIMYGTNVIERSQFGHLIDQFPSIVRKANEAYDIVFVDLPKSNQNKYINEVITDSDLVICTINQETVNLDEFFIDLEKNEFLKNKKKIILICDYEQKSKYNIFNIKSKYKVKDIIMGLPHNYIFSDSCNDGQAVNFFYKNLNADQRDYNGFLISETRKLIKKILEITKQNEKLLK